MTEREKALDKIKKLLALSTSPNEHEAKLAAQRASEIMEKYQVAEAEVLVASIDAEHVISERYTVEDQKMKLNWIPNLAHGCAILFDSTVLVNRALWGTSFTFVGYPDDIQMAKALFEHLYKSWFSICAADLAHAKSCAEYPFQPRDTMKFKAGHGNAFSKAIFNRCYQLAQQRKKAVRESSSSGTALILARDQALDNWREKNGIINIRVAMSAGNSAGRIMGRAAGNNIPLGGAIPGGRRQLKG